MHNACMHDEKARDLPLRDLPFCGVSQKVKERMDLVQPVHFKALIPRIYFKLSTAVL